MRLDIDFVRRQFPQMADDPALVFAANAGGSYICHPVHQILEQYNRHLRVQPYSQFKPSSDAGEAMDRARRLWADALNIDTSELTVGPSTSMNTYVMSHAIAANWKAGDEIIVTNQDHEANSGVWRRRALEKSVTIREWSVNRENGLLDLEQLRPLLNVKTRWVFFPHCSNIIGTVNPVASITQQIKATTGARVLVDAVSYAPHRICDLKALGVDAYVLSLYKVFGPHQGLLYVNRSIRQQLDSQAHYFLAGDAEKDCNPAGPQHAQVAACAGVIDYFNQLHQHHFGMTAASSSKKMQQLGDLIQVYENQLTAPILDFLARRTDVRVLGKISTKDNDRVPTISFQPLKQSAEVVAARLQQAGIGTENGHFYAHRLITDLGVNAQQGVLRLSLLHYNQLCDTEKIIQQLDVALQ